MIIRSLTCTLVYSKYSVFLDTLFCVLLESFTKFIYLVSLFFLKIDWLNKYNKRIRDVMGPEITSQGRSDVHSYMMTSTEPFSKTSVVSSGKTLRQNNFSNVIMAVLCVFSLCNMFGCSY